MIAALSLMLAPPIAAICPIAAIPYSDLKMRQDGSSKLSLDIPSIDNAGASLTIEISKRAVEGQLPHFGLVLFRFPAAPGLEFKPAHLSLDGKALPIEVAAVDGGIGYVDQEKGPDGKQESVASKLARQFVAGGGKVDRTITRTDGVLHALYSFQVPADVVDAIQARSWKCDDA